jgi:Uma2 family endonuclease
MAAPAAKQKANSVAMYLTAVEHLPAGSTLVVPDVTLAEYERLVETLGDNSALRVGYYRGRLEIMSPSRLHETFKELLVKLVYIVEEQTDTVVESQGSTTFRKGTFPGGAEPDTCFYVQHARAIIGKDKIDLRRDPPPDVVVEIDLSSTSSAKRNFYAHIGVPEIWRYDGTRLQILQWTASGYSETSHSLAFPVLTAKRLTQALEQSKTKGQSAALRSFRQWLRKNLPARG